MKFHNTDYAIDPIGPSKGHHHVVRGFYLKWGKFDRSLGKGYEEHSNYVPAYFRLVIKAKELK